VDRVAISNILLKSFDIKKPVAPGIINSAMDNIIPTAFKFDTIISDNIISSP
jgi:hypothetical protein